MSGNLDREMRAMEAFRRLVADAKNARQLFEDADMTIPTSLARLLGEEGSNRRGWRGPKPPPRPNRAKDDWLWVEAKSMLPTELALAVLRREKRPVKASEMSDIIRAEFLEDQNPISILNLGPRLESYGLITRSDEGWVLNDASKAPYLWEKHGWGPVDVFQDQSIAWYRRMLILDLFKTIPGGLMALQILEQMRVAEFHRGPAATKDLIKTDLAALEKDGLIKRYGKKWVLAQREKND